MKWGRISEEAPSERVLYYALSCVLIPGFNEPLDHYLKDILGGYMGLGGDPGWSMYYKENEKGEGYYRVYADPDYTPYTDPNDPIDVANAEVCCSVTKVKEAAKEVLLALAIRFPERAAEAHEVIKRYNL